jgi:RHS repeat-associated protein
MTDLAGQHSYTYDDTYQLTQATHPNMPTEQFGYDAVGNRTASGQPTPTLSTALYAYDFENRLTDVSYSDMVVHYKYDPFGRRIEKNVDGTITKYVYDGPNIVTQYDGDWNVQGKYLFTLDVDDPLMLQQGDNVYYYHKDGLGSVVNLTDSSQTTVKGYTYKSFGDIYSETGSVVQPFTYTGREYDPESGLYYYRARYYDPRAGRFLTRDPIGLAGGDVNLYRYTGNNPVNWIDPDGLFVLAPVLPFLIPAFEAAAAYTGATIAGMAIGGWIWDTWLANEDSSKKEDRCPIPGTKPGRPTKGKTEQREKPGDFDTAKGDFDSLNPTGVKEIPGGEVLAIFPMEEK